MSKLEKQYKELKRQDKDTYYLFKMGIFYNFLNEDADIMSEVFKLKITYITDTLRKCGFPKSSLERNLKVLDNSIGIKYKIIDNQAKVDNTAEYLQNNKCIDILDEIKNMNLDNITPMQAFEKLSKFKNMLGGNK